MALTAIAVLNPVAFDVIRGAFYSGDQLARSLGQLLLMVFGGIAVAMIVLEWLVRWYWARRRRQSGA
jgi:hypothetical protein